MLNEMLLEKSTSYGTTDYDGLWKKIIAELFEEFMEFFAPKLAKEIDFTKPPHFLQQELYKAIISNRKGKNYADQIVKVHLKSGGEKWILVHIEIQSQMNVDFPKRMFRYFYRIYDKFNMEIYAIALLTDDIPSDHASSFEYSFHGTKVHYNYNTYKFKGQSIEELEKSNNPFAAAVIAGKYAYKYKHDVEKRFHFKRKLMVHVLEKFSLHQEKSRMYITTLLYFIDYLLQTPEELDSILKEELFTMIREEGEQLMDTENMELSPTLAGLVEMAKKEFIEQAKDGWKREGKLEGKEEATVHIAKALIHEGFPDGKIAELTGTTIEEIVVIRESLQD